MGGEPAAEQPWLQEAQGPTQTNRQTDKPRQTPPSSSLWGQLGSISPAIRYPSGPAIAASLPLKHPYLLVFHLQSWPGKGASFRVGGGGGFPKLLAPSRSSWAGVWEGRKGLPTNSSPPLPSLELTKLLGAVELTSFPVCAAAEGCWEM